MVKLKCQINFGQPDIDAVGHFKYGCVINLSIISFLLSKMLDNNNDDDNNKTLKDWKEKADRLGLQQKHRLHWVSEWKRS